MLKLSKYKATTQNSHVFRAKVQKFTQLLNDDNLGFLNAHIYIKKWLTIWQKRHKQKNVPFFTGRQGLKERVSKVSRCISTKRPGLSVHTLNSAWTSVFLSYWSPLISFHTLSATLSTTLSHLIPAHTFVTLVLAMIGNFFIGMFHILDCHSRCLTSLPVLSGWIPTSVLDAVLPVVLEHPRTFWVAAICTASSCFTNFALPSHYSPAYSTLGSTTLVRIFTVDTYYYFLASICGSVRIAFILPTCV